MKAKNLSQQLGGLINSTTGGGFTQPPTMGTTSAPIATQGTGGLSYEDSIPDELSDPEPLFTINYKGEQKQCIKKALVSINIIVKEVVPELLQNSPLIMDKIRQDAEQLGNLYYQYKKKETYHQALLDTISHGETEPKRFDVCEKISKSLEELGTKITETQNQIRKYYIDTYLDIQKKDDEDDFAAGTGKLLDKPEEPQGKLTVNLSEADDANIIVGTDDLVKNLEEKKKQMLLSKHKQSHNHEE